MTLEQLKTNLSKLKLPYLECSLFTSQPFDHEGLYICHTESVWQVYVCDQSLQILKAIFEKEEDVYDYVFCYYKKISDSYRIF